MFIRTSDFEILNSTELHIMFNQLRNIDYTPSPMTSYFILKGYKKHNFYTLNSTSAENINQLVVILLKQELQIHLCILLTSHSKFLLQKLAHCLPFLLKYKFDIINFFFLSNLHVLSIVGPLPPTIHRG